MVDPFENSRRKVARAKEQIASLEKEIGLFFNTRPYSVVIEPDPDEPKHQIHKLRFDRSMPDSFANLTEETVHHLRSALDQVTYGLAVAGGKVKPRHAAFPFAGSALEFNTNAPRRCKDVPLEIQAVFRAYQPYKGGNDFLWALSEVSNTDKHELLSIALGSWLGNMNGTGAIVSMAVNPTWDSVKKEIELATCVTGVPVRYNAEYVLLVTFDEIPVVGGEVVLEVLDYFARIVEHILAALETEAKRIGFVK